MISFFSPILLTKIISLTSFADQFRPDHDCQISTSDAIDAGQKLFLFGDPNFINPKSQSDIDVFCKNMEDNTNKLKEYVTCLEDGSARLVFSKLVYGYEKEKENRCSNITWRKDFLKYSECIRNNDLEDNIHQCGYKLHDALKYALDNLDVKHQLQFSCCSMQFIRGCVIKQLVKDCDKKVIRFAPNLFFSPIIEAWNASCPGVKSMKQCRRLYPKQIKDVDKIFDSSANLSPRNLLKIGFQIHQNRGSKLPEFVEN